MSIRIYQFLLENLFILNELIFLSILLTSYPLGESKVFHSGEKWRLNHLSTKSPYFFDEKNQFYDGKTSLDKDCSAEQIWMIVRHGARNPGTEIIQRFQEHLPLLRDEILEKHRNGKGGLPQDIILELTSWQVEPDLHKSKQKWLVPAGEIELKGIAQRFQTRFPELFHKSYQNDTFKLKYTNTQRAKHSAISFVKTLFGDEQAENVYFPTALDADPVIRFYKGCEKWKKQIDKNPESYEEQKRFEESSHFIKMMADVQSRLGLTRPIVYEDIEEMYLACSFETSWHPSRISPWCSAFEESDFKVIEYHQDLEYYWVDGYGHELTPKVACPAIKDFVHHFREKALNPQHPLDVIAYFTHSGTLLKIISRLGLFKDPEPLRSDNFEKMVEKRKWRTSIIDKFATNIAFILFKCGDEYKVGTLFQEKPISLPACKGNWICSLKDIEEYFSDIIQTCDVPSMCKIS